MFDYLKWKDNQKHSRHGTPVETDYDTAAKLVGLQLHSSAISEAGNPDLAEGMVEGFLLEYGRDRRIAPPTETELAQLCYALAYITLPDLVYRQWERFQELWMSPVPFPVFLALFRACYLGQHLSKEQIERFQHRDGQFPDGTIYYLITFPEPPLPDASTSFRVQEAFEDKRDPSPETDGVLGPHHLAVTISPEGQRGLYVLGQSPGPWTTFRMITSDDSNCNLGQGPERGEEAFLRCLEEWLSGAGYL